MAGAEASRDSTASRSVDWAIVASILPRFAWTIWLAIALSVINGRPARAEELRAVSVLGVGGEPPPSALADALRIQLAGRAQVRESKVSVDGSLASKTQSATAALAAEHASLALWVERTSDPAIGEIALLYVVGDQNGQALVVIRQVEAGEGLGVYRTLALKVAEVFELVGESKSPAIERVIGAPSPPADQAVETPGLLRPVAPDRPASPAPQLAFVGDLGGWAATGSATAPLQGGVLFSAGGRLRYGALSSELALQGRVLSDLRRDDERGRAEVSEGGVAVAARLAGVWEFLALGGELGFGGRILSAIGETPSGKRGEGDTIVPFVHLLPQAGFQIAEFMEIRLGFGVEMALRRHRFTVNDSPVLDLGTARGVGAASFVFVAP